MKVLIIIPLFLLLIVFSYVGTLFVEANREEVVISFFNYQSTPMALGFVVLTAILFGMVLAGTLCSVEMMALFFRNRRLRHRLADLSSRKRDENVAPLRPAPEMTRNS